MKGNQKEAKDTSSRGCQNVTLIKDKLDKERSLKKTWKIQILLDINKASKSMLRFGGCKF